MGPRR